jgi:PAS domain S-box-containing protein
MSGLDIRTIFTSYSISNAICAVVMAFLWQQNRRRSPALGFWMANFVMQFLAVLLITLRGVVPDFLSIAAANVLGIAGSMLLYMGMERFVGKVSSQRYNYLLLVLFFCIQMYYTYIQPNLTARDHNFSFAIIIICIQGAWLLFQRVEAGARSETARIGLIFAAFGLVNILRISLGLIFPHGNDLFQSGIFEAVVILIHQILYISLTFSFFLMINHRLVAELEGDIARRNQDIESLRQSEERFRGAFEQVINGMGMISTDGVILRVNQALCQMLGYTEQELVGDIVDDHVYTEDLASAGTRINQSEADKFVAKRVEKRFIHKQGNIVWMTPLPK